MKSIHFFKTAAVLTLVTGLSLFFPQKTSDASSGGMSVDVNLPIAELQGLIQQLQDAGSQLVGEAGVQMRQTIDQLNEQLTQRIDQVKQAGSDLIREASQELRDIIYDLVNQARSLLKEVNDMIAKHIECINYDLAQRINQITEAANDILDKVDVVLKNAIDRIYIRATMLVDTSTSRVAVVLDNTLEIIAKIVILVLCFVMLFWLVRTLWLGKFPKKKVFAIGIPVLIVLLVAGGVFLLFSNKALSKVIGKQIPIPNWQNSCSLGDQYYNDLIARKNAGDPVSGLKEIGKKALEQLNWCLYTSVSPENTQETSEKISEVNALIYPPALPPPVITPLPVNNPCAAGPSINPGWLNGRNLGKLKLLQQMAAKNVLKLAPAMTADKYKTLVYNYRVPAGMKFNEDRVKPVMNMTVPVEKIRPEILEHLKTR